MEKLLKKKVPAIRFKGFDGEWYETALSSFSDIKTGPFGSTLHAEDYVDNGIPIVTTEHFKSWQLPLSKHGVPQVSEKDYIRLSSYVLKREDLVFSRVGSIDINARVGNKQEGWLFSGRVLRVRINADCDSEYLHHELSTWRVRKSIESRAVGQTMPSINTGILGDTIVYLPEYRTEQTKIGHYFKTLDQTLTLHQYKHDKLITLKQAMLQKMFPKSGALTPEVRFKGFEEEWEKKSLEDVVQVCSGRDYKHLSAGNIPVYGTGGYMLSVDAALSYDQDAIGIGRKGTIDKPYILKSPFWTVDTLFYAIPKKNYDLNFVFKIFQCVDWKTKDESTGVPSLSKVAINGVQVLVPKPEEQQKIGNYFQKLDQLIGQHATQLEKLKQIKAACLERMFV